MNTQTARHSVSPFGFLAPLSPEDQALVDDALGWMRFIDEQKTKAAQKGEVCPKDGSRLTWDGFRRVYSCDECGYVERAPVKR